MPLWCVDSSGDRIEKPSSADHRTDSPYTNNRESISSTTTTYLQTNKKWNEIVEIGKYERFRPNGAYCSPAVADNWKFGAKRTFLPTFSILNQKA